MTVRFSTLFKRDLLEAETRYAAISRGLGDEFHERVKETTRAIVERRGGDHIGPHGFPCRRCRPFPFLIYYQIEGDVIYVLGIVYTRRHPDYLKKALGEAGS